MVAGTRIFVILMRIYSHMLDAVVYKYKGFSWFIFDRVEREVRLHITQHALGITHHSRENRVLFRKIYTHAASRLRVSVQMTFPKSNRYHNPNHARANISNVSKVVLDYFYYFFSFFLGRLVKLIEYKNTVNIY